MNGVVLTYEPGSTSGAYEDGIDGVWTAEAQCGGVPIAEGVGDNPLNAVMALAITLAGAVSGELTRIAVERVEAAQFEAEMALTPEQIAAKERLAERRAQAEAL